MAGNQETANDPFQDVLFHVWQRLDQFAGKSAFGTWLWSVGRNRALDQLRKRQPLAIDPSTIQAAAVSDYDSSGIGRDERQQLLHQALATLPDEAREIIILRDFQDHDYPSIANMLGIAEGTVKSRLSRARASLRKALEPHLKAEDLA
jgi:RNA polymerase sigma-70 factor (ECF subfamily)